MSEFDLIRQHFTRQTNHTLLGIGDDAALISVGSGMEIAISTDMLVSGTHFFADTPAYDLGWKSLAVNLSDMAAMGANPKWVTLAIALPQADENWLKQFSSGFFACAEEFNIDLIGGDTTRGPLTISIQIMGEIPTSQAIQRNGAKEGDDVWVSGALGKAALGLDHLLGNQIIPENELEHHLKALHVPQPRISLGLALRSIASSCVDISDGLLADLGHILNASNVATCLQLSAIPTSDFIAQHLEDPKFLHYALAGGDDYELCFTAHNNHQTSLQQLGKTLNLPLTKIGKVIPKQDEATNKILLYGKDNQIIQIGRTGFNHFN